jgi:uncharacterized linocin/CFP29 family protein
MNHLFRDLAPIPASGWAQIDDEARERVTPHLAARRFVDFVGPRGWEFSATDLGRVTTLDATPDKVSDGSVVLRQRRVLPLVEFRVPFTIAGAELEDADRGAVDLELDDLDRAARQAALIENRAVFHGWAAAGMQGIADASPYGPIRFGEDPQGYPQSVAEAVSTLRQAGIDGPYGMAVSPEGYTRILQATEHGGYLLLDHLRRILGGGSVVRSPGVDGALVLGLGGGDFVMEVGQDLSVGYSHHDADTVSLYLEESFSFRVTEPDAAVVLAE